MSTIDEVIAARGVVTEFPRKNGSSSRVLTSGEFVSGFSPPDYTIDGVTQRGFLYSLCGATGSGKTAITLRLLASTGMGHSLGGREVMHGRGLMLVGENPDDVRARWIALAENMGFDEREIDIHFIPGIFPIPDLVNTIRAEASRIGDLTLVVVDTSAAFFTGDDENSNTEAGSHARLLRTLTDLPGRPCVIVNCHPVKNASSDNLLPRGGGAFLAEVDGNLSCRTNDGVVELHWQGKFRGPDFQAIPFELQTVTSPRLVDTRGRPMPTVIARPITEFEQAHREDAAKRELRQVLSAMQASPAGSMASWAHDIGWVSKAGLPNKAKVHRLMRVLQKERLVAKELNEWVLTPTGQKASKRGEKA